MKILALFLIISFNLVAQDNMSLDKKLNQLNNAFPFVSGPNCWNTSLYAAGLNSGIRHTTDSEMAFWMQSPFCKEIDPEETPMIGDVIAIRNKRGEEVHGFVFLSNEESFSKNTLMKDSSFSFQTTDEVYQIFKVNERCQNIHSSKINERKVTCNNYSQIFRCQSVEDFIQNNEFKNNQSIILFRNTNEIEKMFTRVVYSMEGVDELYRERGSIRKELESIKSKVKEQLEAEPGLNDQVLLDSILFKIDSLNLQIGWIEYEKRNDSI
jgi:hypothetical protein